MKNSVFLTFILLLMTVYLHLFSTFKQHFSGIEGYKKKVHHLNHSLKKEKLMVELAEYKLRDYQQEVASLLPSLKLKNPSHEGGYALRSLASVYQKPLETKLALHNAKQLFLKGKSLFRKARYHEANKIFTKLVKEYSFSIYTIESQFLMAEGLFQMREFESAIKVIDRLVTQHPEHELTGFALLRLGQIFEYQDRNEEAEGIYKTVIQTFKDPDLLQQARLSMQAIQL